MANRLSKIVTRTGDEGMTGLGDGSRISKQSVRIQALGDVDELNSLLGVVLCENFPDSEHAALLTIQRDLFDLGGELSIPGHAMLTADRLERLDRWIAQWNAELPPLKEFILPGGCRAAALLHVARTVCRRAERNVAGLDAQARSPLALPYLNRLSDLLFVLARVVNRRAGQAEPLWRE